MDVDYKAGLDMPDRNRHIVLRHHLHLFEQQHIRIRNY